MENQEEPINFGTSLIVPSVQEFVKQSITNIPPRYVHHDQLPASVKAPAPTPSVPVIDLHCLFAEASGSSAYSSELNKLHTASKEWGFFQKLKLWQDEDIHEGFSQLFVVSEEQKLDWSDMLYLTTLPHNLRKSQLFKKLPPILREKQEAYTTETKRLAVAILRQMAKALEMDTQEMTELFDDGVQSVRMNYYPPCPQPEMTLGFSPHSDADALTILYQLNETTGLQIRKDGKWVTIKPLANELVVNIGDILEVVSNGVYKSIEHQVTVNSKSERMSVATFYSSNMGTELGPARSLVSKHNAANFRRVPLEAYFKEFFARKLAGKSYLDFMKLA